MTRERSCKDEKAWRLKRDGVWRGGLSRPRVSDVIGCLTVSAALDGAKP